LYGVVIFVFPAWRGTFEVYVLGEPTVAVSGLLESQGSGLSIPAVAGGIKLSGYADEFIWLYGHAMRLDRSHTYVLTLLPHSNIVIDVTSIDSTTTTTAVSPTLQ
jgi:hypothetical protein